MADQHPHTSLVRQIETNETRPRFRSRFRSKMAGIVIPTHPLRPAMNTRSFTSRRRFLQSTTLAAGATVIGSPAVVSARSPNSKMNVACIAAGGRGRSHVNEAKKMSDLVELVALCDVNSKALESAAAQFPKARTYKDFRELHAKMDDIDAVFIATTEHTHAFAIIPRCGPRSTSIARSRSRATSSNAVRSWRRRRRPTSPPKWARRSIRHRIIIAWSN